MRHLCKQSTRSILEIRNENEVVPITNTTKMLPRRGIRSGNERKIRK
jgi:hypothetical protein